MAAIVVRPARILLFEVTASRSGDLPSWEFIRHGFRSSSKERRQLVGAKYARKSAREHGPPGAAANSRACSSIRAQRHHLLATR
jgi:hypothetical protein